MSDYVKVASVSDVPDPGKSVVEVDDRMVVLLHIGGEFYCIDDICTHDGGPLSDGDLQGTQIACPRHGAKFDVCSGKALTMPATEDTLVHEVKVEGEDIFVRLNEEAD
jgi:3-phenylpropionate/trans-cinnamate dioxygenase ferredoxin subunit